MDRDALRQSRPTVVRLIASVVFVSSLALACPCTATENSELAQRLETLRAAGHPTSLAELAQREQIPEGVRNAAELYEAAGKAFVLPTEANRANVPMLGQAGLPDLGESLPEPMAEAIEAYLQRNSKCLSLLHEAAGLEHCQFDRDEDGEPLIGEEKACVHLLALAAVYQAGRGDRDSAVACLADALRLCEVTPDEQSLLGHIRRCACIGLIARRIEQVLNLTTLEDQQLAKLDRACAQTAAALDIAKALDAERCFTIERWTNPKLLVEEHGFALVVIAPVTEKALLFSLDYMADCIEAVNLPLSQRLARIDEIDKPLEEMEARFDEAEPTPQDPRFPEVMGALALPNVRRAVELDLSCRADLRSMRTVLAAQRYRLAEGRLPETLDQLVLKYLDSVPSDPFDGRPIRYRRTEPGFVVYSVWWDGQDNGGLRKGDAKRGEPFDSPFVVLQ